MQAVVRVVCIGMVIAIFALLISVVWNAEKEIAFTDLPCELRSDVAPYNNGMLHFAVFRMSYGNQERWMSAPIKPANLHVLVREDGKDITTMSGRTKGWDVYDVVLLVPAQSDKDHWDQFIAGLSAAKRLLPPKPHVIPSR